MARWQAYYTPKTIDEALTALVRHEGRAQIIAGGTDLILDIQQENHPAPEALVDVTAIAGLNEIWEEEGWIYLGAATTHAQIEASDLVRQHGAALTESCGVVGGPQVRNVGTLGGNVAHALPAADGTIGLLALGAEVQVCTLTSRDWRAPGSRCWRSLPGRARTTWRPTRCWPRSAFPRFSRARAAPSTASCARRAWRCRSSAWRPS
jgi:CO/xanthine dehydrogenase FAD-binding subunit